MKRTKNEINASIGARIQKIRTERNITQEKLAELVDLSSSQQISEIERGLSGISVQKLMDFCKALDIDADYLLFGTASRNPDNPMNKYLSKMTAEQSKCAEELIAAYAKSCGIK